MAIYQSSTLLSTTGYGIELKPAAGGNNFACSIINVLINLTWNGILVFGSIGTAVEDCIFTNLRGNYGLNFTGSATQQSASCKVSNLGTSMFSPWTNTNIKWINHDSYGNTLWVLWSECIGGGYGFFMDDSAGAGASSRSNGAFIHFLACDHNQYEGIYLYRGEIVQITNSSVVSSLAGNGITVHGAFTGEVAIDTTRIFGNWYNGVRIDRGPVDVRVTNCVISANSAQGRGVCHGIYVDGGTTRFMIRGNRIGSSVDAPGPNNQSYGVFLNAGYTYGFVISDNSITGNVNIGTQGVLNLSYYGTTYGILANNSVWG